jgi:hypothetical protein
MTNKDQVLEILKTDEQSRNSDDRLFQMILYVYNRNLLFQDQDGDWAIKLKRLPEAPKQSDMQRYRAFWQNVKRLFLPTSQQVLRLRLSKQERMHDEFVNDNPAKG